MDAALFTDHRTGRLLEIHGAFGREWAFVPNPLPPTWTFPVRLWPLLDSATSALARLDGAGRHMQNPELIMRPLELREAVQSSRLEGTIAEPEEVLLFEMNPRESSSEDDPVNARREVSNYARALRQGRADLTKGEGFSCDLVRRLHGILLEGVRGHDKQPGEFRDVQVKIDANARYVPPPVKQMRVCLDALDAVLRSGPPEASQCPPLVWCYLVHYQFEAIHPFRDGNGRIGRVLLSLMTYRLTGMSLPWLYMSAYFDRRKQEYIRYLFECSSEGRWEQWIEFCLQGTLEQAQDSIRRVDALVMLGKQYHSLVDPAAPRLHKILDELFERPVTTVPRLQKIFDISWPTARTDIDALVRLGILAPIAERRRPLAYFAPEIFRIAYGENETT